MIKIILGVAMLHQSRQLGELPVAFDEGQDIEVDSSLPFCHFSGTGAVVGSYPPPPIFKMGW
jgi:hypothetical protein